MRVHVISVAVLFCCGLLAFGSLGAAQQPLMDSQWASEGDMHAYFVDRFLESPGNGRGRMVRSPMTIWPSMRLIIECEPSTKAMVVALGEYKIDSLDLIGIAKRSGPVAFVTRSHGDPDGQTRSLTPFEQKALVELRSGRTVVSQMDKSGNAVVVGSVLARAECVRCHAPSRTGDLLGAFSYQLTAVDPDKSKAPSRGR